MFKKSLLHILLITSIILVIFGLNYSEQIVFDDFKGGLRNDIEADLIADNESPDCENVIINEKGNSLQKRKGFTLYKTLTSSSTYGCQGFIRFRDQSTSNDYFIVAHGSMVSKINVSTEVNFITDRSTFTFTDFTYDDDKIFGCNGYDYNWNYDGTTVISTATYSVTVGTITTYGSAPKTFTHAFYQDRYFVACSTTYPNRVWQYYFNQPTNLTTYDYDNPDLAADQYDIGASGERIVKLYPYNIGLLVFKSKSIWKIIGDGTPFQIIEITQNLGCQNPNSVVEDAGLLYFLGSDNYWYMYDGTSFYKLSEKIMGTMDNINQITQVYKSWILDSYTEFEIGTSSHTRIDYYTDTIERQDLVDDFSAGNLNKWTSRYSDAELISKTNTLTNATENFVRSSTSSIEAVNSAIYREQFVTASTSTLLGTWAFDFYLDTGTFVHGSTNYLDFMISSIRYPATFGEYVRVRFTTDENYPNRISIELKFASGSGYFLIYSTTVTPYAPQDTHNCKVIIYEDEYGVNTYKVVLDGEQVFDQMISSPTPEIKFLNFFIQSIDNVSYGAITNIYYPTPIDTDSYYISPIEDFGNSYIFNNFSAIENLQDEQITYFMRTNTSSTTILSDSWTQINNNETPSLTTDKYVQWKSSFTSTDVSISPKLDSVTIDYIDTSAKLVVQGDAAAKIYKNRLYCSVNNFEVDNVLYNNYVLIYDLLIKSWWQTSNVYGYTFEVLNNELYLADSRYGIILKQTDSHYDYNGATNENESIDAYYYTKQHYLGSSYNNKKLNYLSFVMKKQSTGSLLIDYLINGVESSNNMTYSQIGTTPAKVYISNYPLGEIGYYYQWKFSNNESGTPFELYNFMTDYTILPTRRTQ